MTNFERLSAIKSLKEMQMFLYLNAASISSMSKIKQWLLLPADDAYKRFIDMEVK